METKTPKLPEKIKEYKLPTLNEILSGNEIAAESEALNVILNANPPEKWIKIHPNISGYKYLPIDKVEYLLRKIFKRYKIQVLERGMLLNSVSVTVRVNYFNPVTNEWEFHDGVGAQELQTEKGSGTLKMDMTNINRGAMAMALPIAKTMAVKDACDHLGNIFGANLNRKDVIQFTPDIELIKSRYDKALKDE